MSTPPRTMFNIDISAELAKLAAEVGFIPHVVFPSLRWHINDMMDHHKRLVLKNHTMADKPGGRRFIAAHMGTYGKLYEGSKGYLVRGGSFAAATSFDPSDRGQMLALETSATVNAKALMAVPLDTSRKGQRALKKLIASKKGVLIRRAGKPPLIAKELKGTGKARTGKDWKGYLTTKQGARLEIVGALTRRRLQGKKIDFAKYADEAEVKSQQKRGAMLEASMTFAGRMKIADHLRTQSTRETFAQQVKAGRLAAAEAKKKGIAAGEAAAKTNAIGGGGA